MASARLVSSDIDKLRPPFLSRLTPSGREEWMISQKAAILDSRLRALLVNMDLYRPIDTTPAVQAAFYRETLKTFFGGLPEGALVSRSRAIFLRNALEHDAVIPKNLLAAVSRFKE